MKKRLLRIEVIGHRFDDMTKKIDNLIKDVYLARMHQQEMELLALTNQINPHFLYNVLQLIQTKAVIARNNEIEEMIIALGQMLRYTMERTGERVKIQDEMNYIQNYLKFYKARFDSLFDYEIIYDPDILSKTMLKFIIQPIVENCFKHGFKNKKEGGVIRIKIYEEGTDIVFDVYDNGDGISDARIKKIYEGLDNHTNIAGIGIQNTDLRLKLVYGNNYGIHINSQIGEFTQVIARIKAEENQEVHNV